jgi:hypothetical protein
MKYNQSHERPPEPSMMLHLVPYTQFHAEPLPDSLGPLIISG